MRDEASPRPWFVNGHSIEANDPDGLWLQNEKTGRGVVANLPSCPKSRMSTKNRKTWDAIVEANAALIVDAVNLHDVTREDRHKLQEANEELFVLRAERDRLNEDIESWRRGYIKAQTERNAFFLERDRLRDLVRRLTEYVDAVTAYHPPAIEVVSSEHPTWAFDGAELLREARAAIGEGQP